jgi:hypothetical protein
LTRKRSPSISRRPLPYNKRAISWCVPDKVLSKALGSLWLNTVGKRGFFHYQKLG